MYILKSLLAFSLLFPVFVCNAQEKDIAKNSVFLEIFGTGGLYSINYEKTINPLVFIRLGGNHFKFKSKEEVLTLSSFPAMVTILTGEKKNHIELSGGTLIGYTKDHNTTKTILNFTFFVGYRFQPQFNGILFRFGISSSYPLELNAYYKNYYLFISAGLSFGYHF